MIMLIMIMAIKNWLTYGVVHGIWTSESPTLWGIEYILYTPGHKPSPVPKQRDTPISGNMHGAWSVRSTYRGHSRHLRQRAALIWSWSLEF